MLFDKRIVYGFTYIIIQSYPKKIPKTLYLISIKINNNMGQFLARVWWSHMYMVDAEKYFGYIDCIWTLDRLR